MEALVTVGELQDRLPFDMDPDEEREASGALEDLSDDARFYGKPTWDTPATTPRQVKNLILRAAVRHMKNYEGYTTSRAGDETVAWTDRGHESGSAYFTEREIKMLRSFAGNGRTGFYTVGTYAYQGEQRRQVGLVRDELSSEPIQFFASEDPW